METRTACQYLRNKEWSMGNGQCPACHACGPSWLGFGGWGNDIGHLEGCGMAASLVALGQPVVMHAHYDRIANKNSPTGVFGNVNWESENTKALVESIRRAHPEMFEQSHDGEERRG